MITKVSKKFSYSHDLTGLSSPVVKTFPIATATAIEKGEIVVVTAGKVVSGADTADVLGISRDLHDGSTEGQTDTKIAVYSSPSAVFACIPSKVIVADADSTTASFVDLTLAGHADDAFNGGHLIVVTNAGEGATGKVYGITDFNGTTGAIATDGGVFATDDTCILLPPVLSKVMGMDSDGTNLDLATTGDAITIVDVDTETQTVYISFDKHQLGN